MSIPPPRPRLLLLPGLACDAALWRDQLPLLSARGPVHISTAHSRCASITEMAATLLAEHPAPVAGTAPDLALAGSSMGGMLAMEIVRQAPQRIAGLALLGTSARPDTPELIALRTQACALFAQGRMDEVLRANVMFAFHPRHAANPTMVADYLAMMVRAGADQLIAQNQAVMRRPDRRPDLPGIACPTLVVGGLADLLTPPECAQEMAAAIPGAQLHLLVDAGHLLTWEAPEQVNRLLLDWWLAL